MNAAKYLPEKYNEIMNLFYTNEIRVYLPIQELNILLEPLKSQGELTASEENEENDYIRIKDMMESNEESDESSVEDEDLDQEEHLQEDTLNKENDNPIDNQLFDMENDSNSSVENLNSIDF